MPKKRQSKVNDGEAPGAPAEDREQRIRELAYALWDKAGQPPGLPIAFWLEAEEAIDEGDLPESERPS